MKALTALGTAMAPTAAATTAAAAPTLSSIGSNFGPLGSIAGAGLDGTLTPEMLGQQVKALTKGSKPGSPAPTPQMQMPQAPQPQGPEPDLSDLRTLLESRAIFGR